MSFGYLLEVASTQYLAPHKLPIDNTLKLQFFICGELIPCWIRISELLIESYYCCCWGNLEIEDQDQSNAQKYTLRANFFMIMIPKTAGFHQKITTSNIYLREGWKMC